LCPRCVKSVRAAVLSGERDLSTLVNGKPGEVRAHIVEENGQVKMVKTCAVHGRFEDVISIDPAFLRRVERLYPGRDFLTPLTCSETTEAPASSTGAGRSSRSI
jgi:7,8-dihydro-6-hydroxymethylpterin dimethyltransferase